MKKFVVMYRVPVEVMKKWRESTPDAERKAQEEKLEKDMYAWFDTHKDAVVDSGNPLGKNTRMTIRGALAESNDLNYYNIIQAESIEDVIAMHKDNPHITIPEAFLDIMEVPRMAAQA